MTEDDLADNIAANAMGAVWANPMMRLTAISQAAASFAQVAQSAFDIGYGVALTAENDVRAHALAVRYFKVRDACLSHIEELLKQIKNEPTP